MVIFFDVVRFKYLKIILSSFFIVDKLELEEGFLRSMVLARYTLEMIFGWSFKIFQA